MKKERSKVAVVKCDSYNQRQVDKAVFEALKLIEFSPKKRSKVLLKPNVVAADRKHQIAISTNPAVLRAVCKFLKNFNCKIYVGESSFMDTEHFLDKAGITKVAKQYGKLIVFEEQKFVYIRDKKAKILKKFPIAKIMKEVDYIINLPKMKTHVLTKMTGAVKNLYGVIPGGLKQRYHKKAKGDKKFSKLLVDIYQNIKPDVNLMDGIIGMEGHGPTSGQPKKANLILASKNAIALDSAVAQIIGLKPKKVFVIKEAVKRKLGSYKFNLVGLEKLPNIHFRKPRKDSRASILRSKWGEKPIVVDKSKCIQCGLCARRCPVKAIKLEPFPVIDRKKCIRCFCCIEICPVQALSLGK